MLHVNFVVCSGKGSNDLESRIAEALMGMPEYGAKQFYYSFGHRRRGDANLIQLTGAASGVVVNDDQMGSAVMTLGGEMKLYNRIAEVVNGVSESHEVSQDPRLSTVLPKNKERVAKAA